MKLANFDRSMYSYNKRTNSCHVHGYYRVMPEVDAFFRYGD
jgi:hypothetical protein